MSHVKGTHLRCCLVITPYWLAGGISGISQTSRSHLHTQPLVPAVCRNLSRQNRLRLAGHAQLTRPRLAGLPGQSLMRFQTLRGTPCGLLRGAERRETLMRQSLGQSLKLHLPPRTSCKILYIFSQMYNRPYHASLHCLISSIKGALSKSSQGTCQCMVGSGRSPVLHGIPDQACSAQG